MLCLPVIFVISRLIPTTIETVPEYFVLMKEIAVEKLEAIGVVKYVVELRPVLRFI